MDLHFGCTQCGRCCQNVRIPLTASEALAWLQAGNRVDLLCDASLWPPPAAADPEHSAHRQRRSFAASSGTAALRVLVILVANVVGPCPNLLPDLRCGIYERRPLVCRIYPAEINPFRPLEPRHKACPTEAWSARQPLWRRAGEFSDDSVRRDILQWRATDAREATLRRRLCAILGLTDAAWAEEGFVVYAPEGAALQAALAQALAAGDAERPGADDRWRLVAPHRETFDALRRAGALVVEAPTAAGSAVHYLGLKTATPAA